MKKTLTRVETKKLKTAVQKANDHLDQALKLLSPYLAVLTDRQRASILRPRGDFLAVGPVLARAAADYPALAEISGFDPEAVVEDLDNVAALTTTLEKVAEISRRLADTKLRWLGEAWSPALALYALAKVTARTDGALRALIDPIAPMFASSRPRAPKGKAQPPVE